MDLPLQLTIEQEFNLKLYTEQARQLSAEQAQDMLIEVMRQTMIKDNVLRHLMKRGLPF